MEIKERIDKRMNEITTFDRNDVQYYDHLTQKLSHSMRHKALKFVEKDLVKHISLDHYQVHPIAGYNTRIYDIRFNQGTGWRCNCQGWKENHFCSHVLAVIYVIKGGKEK